MGNKMKGCLIALIVLMTIVLIVLNDCTGIIYRHKHLILMNDLSFVERTEIKLDLSWILHGDSKSFYPSNPNIFVINRRKETPYSKFFNKYNSKMKAEVELLGFWSIKALVTDYNFIYPAHFDTAPRHSSAHMIKGLRAEYVFGFLESQQKENCNFIDEYLAFLSDVWSESSKEWLRNLNEKAIQYAHENKIELIHYSRDHALY